MKKFIVQIIIFIGLTAAILLSLILLTSGLVESRGFKNHQTESNLLILEEGESYDLGFLGISHARNFSRHSNHLRLEKMMNLRFINLAQGGNACGVNEQFFYLKYFYEKENEANIIVYVLSPPLMFSETLPVASNTFDFEPLNFQFLKKYLTFKSENKDERIFSYLQSKGSWDWLTHQPEALEKRKKSLKELDSSIVKEGVNYAYQGRLNQKRFDHNGKLVKSTIDLALKQNAKVILIIPPALFGKWPGHDQINKFAKQMAKSEQVFFYDFSESVLNAKYYYDHHHLNSDGVDFFAMKYLNPVIQKARQ